MEKSIGLSSAKQKYRTYIAQDTSFPDHIHRTYEVMTVLKGHFSTTIDDKEYFLDVGDCVVIFPLQHHLFTVEKDAAVRIFLFSPDYVPEFDQEVHNMRPISPIFTPEPNLFFPQKPLNALQVRSFFYCLCSTITNFVSFVPTEQCSAKNSAVEKALLFIDEHYDEDCSLRLVAESIKYEYSYLSKLFQKHTGYTFSEYLNNYRIKRAQYLLLDPNTTITSIANDVGYNSVRTFNREFLKITEYTPTEYRSLYVAY